ncbi:hypothetical protein YC2023_062611 [Brassica napus]
MGMDLRVVLAEEWWEERGRDSSLDGERDLGLMVTDFLETGGGGSGGGGGDSWCSSDSDSEFLDPSYLSDQIQRIVASVLSSAAYNFLATPHPFVAEDFLTISRLIKMRIVASVLSSAAYNVLATPNHNPKFDPTSPPPPFDSSSPSLFLTLFIYKSL